MHQFMLMERFSLNARQVIQKGTLLFVMPEERSMDIDSELDFRWVDFLMNDANRMLKNGKTLSNL